MKKHARTPGSTRAQRLKRTAVAPEGPGISLSPGFSAGDAADALRRIIDVEIQRVQRVKTSDQQRRLSMQTVAKTIRDLAILTGEAREVNERTFVRTPVWRALRERIVEALRPWPEAAIAVARALEGAP